MISDTPLGLLRIPVALMVRPRGEIFESTLMDSTVAVTRAQALLIVVGDPYVLSLDPLWRSFLNYVHINKGWRGIPIPWDPLEPVRDSGGYDAELRELGLSDMNDFTRRMESLTLGSIDDIDEADANVDRPWREAE